MTAGAPRERTTLALLLACFFLSGLAALIYQTAWAKQFAFVFGTSELAVATVLAAYMAGLALGAAVGARLAPRIRRPVFAYAILELGVGLTALAVPQAIELSSGLYERLFTAGGLAESSGAGFTAFYLGCSLAILVVPTALMGATLPLLISHAVRSPEQIGERVSVLYGANTVGAVAGTLLAGFALLPALGLRLTIWVAVAVNGLVFVAAVGLARSVGEAPPPEPTPRVEVTGRRAWILPMILLSGVASFTYEVLWTRLLAHVLGGSVYAFATMLATFLTGIALGALLAGRFATAPRRAAMAFGWAQLGTATLALLAYLSLHWLPGLVRQLAAGTGANPGQDALIASLVLLPSTICIGATFPLAVRVLAEREGDAGPASARVYAWNTVGAIVGALGAGFFAIPALGYALCVTVAVLINLALGAASALLVPGISRRVWAVAGALAVALVFLRIQPPWAVLLASLGGAETARGPVVDYFVGRTATVLSLEQPHGWQLRTNGLTEAEIMRRGERAALDKASHWLGLLPVLARPDAQSLFSVGLGGGVAIEDLPETLERIDVVELEPRVVEANRNVGAARRSDPLADPRVHVAVNDARATLLLTERRYDAIISQPSHPWSAGASHLYTKDFFALAHSRLTERGVFVQWMGSQFVDVELLRTLVATLRSVFTHVRVYSPIIQGSLLFVASDEPLDLEASAARAIAADPTPYAANGLLTSDDVRIGLLLDDAGSRRFAEGAPLNTDDHNLLQVRSPRMLVHAVENQAGLVRALGPYDPLLRISDEDERVWLVRRLIRGRLVDRAVRVASAVEDRAQAERLQRLVRAWTGQATAAQIREAALADPPDAEMRALLLRLPDGPDGPAALPAPLSREEQAVVAARAHRAEDHWHHVEMLDDALGAIDPRHPLYELAVGFRVDWRLAGGDAARAREAMALLRPLLAMWPETTTLARRAEAAALAGDAASVLGSARELAGRPDATPVDWTRALRALEASADGDAPRRESTLAVLRQRLAGGSIRR